MSVMFTKAERKKAKLRMALCGTSGSGKTYSGILIAKGMGGKIALIDTEAGSGELYADIAEYDTCTLSAPFSPQKYIEAIRAAEQAGYDTIIIDSLSHAWAGEGGLLDQHDLAAKSAKNSFAAWREITPLHNRLVDTVLQSPCHIIACMRTKTEYIIQADEKGKQAPRKVGMAPVQRDGLEYEFTLVLDLTADGHVATASKDRTSLFDNMHFIPTPETGKQLLKWLESGSDKPAPATSIPTEPQSHDKHNPKKEQKDKAQTPPPAPVGLHGMKLYKDIYEDMKSSEASIEENRAAAKQMLKDISKTVIGREVSLKEQLEALTPEECDTIRAGFKKWLNGELQMTGTDEVPF